MTSRSTKPHDRHRAVRARLSAVAAITACLTVLGSGVASAAWWASDTASSSAAAATVGVDLVAGSLGVTYSSTTTGAATTVTITNTSSREGTYTLTVAPTGASHTLNPTLVDVKIGKAATCAPTATLTEAVSGVTLAGAVKTGTLAAGAPVTLCVITTMTAPNIASQGNNSLAATIKAKIDVGTWSATRESAAFTQNVAVSAPLVQQSSRNNIMNANQCVAGRNNIVSRNNVCGYNDNGQVRITSDGSGNYFIARAKNSSEQPTAPRWSLTSATGDVTTVAPSNASSQKWKLITRPDGLLRIESVAFPDYCATVSWTWDYTTNGYLIKGSLCNDSLASQGFSLAPVGSPVPAVPYPIVCTRNDGAGYLNLTWGFDPEYQQEQKFRVVVSGKVVTPNYIHDYTATSHLYPANLAAQSIAYGPSVTINIEQSIAGSPWEVVATRTISYTSPGVVMCS